MKKWLIGMVLLVIVTVLTGCSLSFVEELLSSNDNENNVIEENTDNQENDPLNNANIDNMNNNGEDANHNLNEAGINNSDDDGNNENEKSETPNQFEACEEEGHDKVLDRIDAEFFLPDCAVLTNINRKDVGFSAYLEIENGNWEEIGNAYIEVYEDKIVNERINIKDERIILKIAFEENHSIELDIKQHDELTKLAVFYKR